MEWGKIPLEETRNYIDKKYTHKHSDVNNHVYNMRRALPRHISVEDFEDIVLTSVAPGEDDFLQNYYIKSETIGGTAYILKNIPHKILRARAESLLQAADVTDEEREFLHSKYKLNEKEDKYVLEHPNLITEADEMRMLNIIGQKALQERAEVLGTGSFYISDYEKYEISQTLEKVPNIPKKDIIFANVDINQEHPYFFEHPQEHIPGMYIIEAGRQFVIATAHVYGNVPMDGIFMLTKMNCSFINYMELNFKVKMRWKPKELKLNKQGAWSYLLGEVTFYQKNREVAIVEYEASIVNKALFARLRSEKDDYDQMPRFRPLPGLEDRLSIRDEDNKFLCYIVDVSMNGFLVQFQTEEYFLKATRPEGEDPEELSFHMYFAKIGFIHGKCKMKWNVENASNNYIAGFQITHISKIDKENLRDAIKFYFKVREDREIL